MYKALNTPEVTHSTHQIATIGLYHKYNSEMNGITVQKVEQTTLSLSTIKVRKLLDSMWPKYLSSRLQILWLSGKNYN